MPKGGEFLIRETDAHALFIPEEFDSEQQLIAQTCREFVDREVIPRLDEIDRQEAGLMPSLLKKAGELGLLAVTFPEAYGGSGLGFNTGLLVAESIGFGHAFAVSFLAHTGIGTLPILYYGTKEQIARYLPGLAAGQQLAAYCLTEPDAGSDARAGKTHARMANGGRTFVLNGQKMWITNGGFADVFIVFAKVEDDTELSAFIVEKRFGGISMNPEERKMGIKGSSTRQIFFNDCPVPASNLLFERGQGFRIAVNILNTGRIKLCAAALGSCHEVLRKSVRYACQRVQFGAPIGSFGAIQHKLAEMRIRTYAVESAMYRTGHAIEKMQARLAENGDGIQEAKLKSIEQYAVECAILKVAGSECLDYVVDEGVQIFGGMGFSAEGPMERAYRDARINRIFEGTNEINRLLIVDMLLKRAMKGELDLMGPARDTASGLLRIPDLADKPTSEFPAAEKRMLAGMKRSVLLVAGAAVQTFKQDLDKEQELILCLADMVSLVYLAESALLRAIKLRHRDAPQADMAVEMARVYLYAATDRVWLAGKEAIQAFASGDEFSMLLIGLKRFSKAERYNLKEARRRIAGNLLQGKA